MRWGTREVGRCDEVVDWGGGGVEDGFVGDGVDLGVGHQAHGPGAVVIGH